MSPNVLGYWDVKTSFVLPDDLEPPQRHPKAAGPGEPIRRHNPMCLGCGDDAVRGLHLTVRASADPAERFVVTAELEVEQWMEGGPGVIHGGLLATAFDEVCSTAPLLVGPAAVTAHLGVDFAAPTPVGATLYLRAEVLGRVRRKVYVAASAHIGDPNAQVATAESMLVMIDARAHFADHLDNSGLADEHKARLSRP